MRKTAIFTFAVCLLGWSASLVGYTPEKIQTIKIVPDPAFGQGVAWDTIFNQSLDKSLAFLPDGGFYRGSNQEGKIYKFDAAGKIVKSFGRKGQGPGDLLGVSALDILDGKFLVVFEGARFISLFDLAGTFIKKLPLNGAIYAMMALRNGKVALVRELAAGPDPKWFKGRYSVLSLDIESGTEKELASFDYAVPRGEFFIRITQFDRSPRLAKTTPDTLAMAFPSSPEILLYSLDGEKKGSFKLDIEPVKFTWDILSYVMDLDHDAQGLKIMTLNKSKVALPENLPYHLGIAGDSEGRIAVFENGFAQKTHDVSFRLYAQDGKLLSVNKIDPGAYDIVQPQRFQNGCAYSWLAKKDGDGSFVFGRWKTGL
ncbi:MAG: hypothetical protein NTZ26_02810 [Candidatus Aminicenantes bacterium]|nr:hypothetical protein [Candidatus Aminicenantes bacterium]